MMHIYRMKTQKPPQLSEVLPGIHHFDTGPFNWYVLVEYGRLTLVDAGFPGHYHIFRNGIATMGFEPKDVEAIILTHAHADHVGFAERVRRESGAPVFVHQEDAAMARQPLQLPWRGLISNAWRPFTAKMLGIATFNGVFTLQHPTQVQTFRDGQPLVVPGRPTVVHCPGHTQGEVAFLLGDSQTLISGDALVTRNLLTGEVGRPQLTGRCLDDDFNQANDSLDRLRGLGNITLLPGHGTPWYGGIAEAVDMARSQEY